MDETISTGASLEVKVTVAKRNRRGILDGETVNPKASLDHVELVKTEHGTKALRWHYRDGSVYEMVEFCDSAKCSLEGGPCCRHDGVPLWVQQQFGQTRPDLAGWGAHTCPFLGGDSGLRDPVDDSIVPLKKDADGNLIDTPGMKPLCTLMTNVVQTAPLTCYESPSPQDLDGENGFIARWGCTIRYRRVK